MGEWNEPREPRPPAGRGDDGDSREQDNRQAWGLLEKVVQGSLQEQRRARRWSIFFKLLTFGYLVAAVWLFYPRELPGVSAATGPHVGAVRLDGVIAEGERASADMVARGLRRAFEQERVEAVMLVINSPGGSPVQSEYLYNEIRRLRQRHPHKPVYAVIGDIGASGAYYIAAAADHIYASPASLVGSIGVVSGGFGFVDALDKLGIERRLFTAGESKALLDPFSPLPESQREHWQQVLDETHALFTERVREGRGERLQDTPELFSGLIWSGRQAIDLGLVDGLGSPGQVARDVIGVEAVVDYTVRRDPLQTLLSRMSSSAGEGFARGLQYWLGPVNLR